MEELEQAAGRLKEAAIRPLALRLGTSGSFFVFCFWFFILVFVPGDFVAKYPAGLIWLINAHSFRTVHSALFALGSKIAHSCQPNLFYTRHSPEFSLFLCQLSSRWFSLFFAVSVVCVCFGAASTNVAKGFASPSENQQNEISRRSLTRVALQHGGGCSVPGASTHRQGRSAGILIYRQGATLWHRG